MVLKYVVDKQFDNVLEILKSKLFISERLLAKLKRNKKILLNNIPSSVKSPVKIGDLIEVYIDFEEDNSNIVPNNMPLNIIYEDDCFLIVDKPFNCAVHPSCYHYSDSLSNGVRSYFDSIGLKKKIRPVNRLDKDTSGLVVFSKNEYIQECLIRQMKDNTFKKDYTAIVEGILPEKNGTLDFPISRKSGSIIERCVCESGATSVTHYDVLKEFEIDGKTFSYVHCRLETGRTHQIRVHFSHISHPLLGDTLYGSASPYIHRQALNCSKLSFIHPICNKKMEFYSSYNLLKELNSKRTVKN